MNRRGFIGTLLGGIFTAAEIAADPDKLLWTPKLISIPTPASGLAFSKDTFSLTAIDLPMPPSISAITHEALHLMRNNIRYAHYIQQDYNLHLSHVLDATRYSVGNTLTIRRPPSYRRT